MGREAHNTQRKSRCIFPYAILFVFYKFLKLIFALVRARVNPYKCLHTPYKCFESINMSTAYQSIMSHFLLHSPSPSHYYLYMFSFFFSLFLTFQSQKKRTHKQIIFSFTNRKKKPLTFSTILSLSHFLVSFPSIQNVGHFFTGFVVASFNFLCFTGVATTIGSSSHQSMKKRFHI